MMQEGDELRRICEHLIPKDNRGLAKPVPVDLIRGWMESRLLDVRGVVFDFIMDPVRAARIVPPLAFEDYRHFVLDYLFRCITGDRTSKWVLRSPEACGALLRWFGVIWADLSVDKEALHEAKTLLRTLCVDYGPNVRGRVITEILEHLFENPSVRNFFDDWQTDPGLQGAYAEADEWQRLGGSSPMAPKGSRKALGF